MPHGTGPGWRTVVLFHLSRATFHRSCMLERCAALSIPPTDPGLGSAAHRASFTFQILHARTESHTTEPRPALRRHMPWARHQAHQCRLHTAQCTCASPQTHDIPAWARHTCHSPGDPARRSGATLHKPADVATFAGTTTSVSDRVHPARIALRSPYTACPGPGAAATARGRRMQDLHPHAAVHGTQDPRPPHNPKSKMGGSRNLFLILDATSARFTRQVRPTRSAQRPQLVLPSPRICARAPRNTGEA